MWGCEDVDLQVWGCEDVDLQMWGCEDLDLQMWGCEDVDLQVWRCEDVDLQMWGCEDVDLQVWGCEDVDLQMWGCEDVDLQVWGCEDVDQQMWGCEDVDQQMWGCEDVDQQMWRCEDVDQQMWRCEDVDQQMWGCEDVDQQMWRSEDLDQQMQGVKMYYNSCFFTKNPSQALSGKNHPSYNIAPYDEDSTLTTKTNYAKIHFWRTQPPLMAPRLSSTRRAALLQWAICCRVVSPHHPQQPGREAHLLIFPTEHYGAIPHHVKQLLREVLPIWQPMQLLDHPPTASNTVPPQKKITHPTRLHHVTNIQLLSKIQTWLKPIFDAPNLRWWHQDFHQRAAQLCYSEPFVVGSCLHTTRSSQGPKLST